MARGRFISKSIAHNEELASVSLEADYLFGRLIPLADCEGRLSGNADIVKAKACPLRPEIPVGIIDGLLNELAHARDIDGTPLIQWYEIDGKRFIQFPGFDDQQKGLRKDREADSKIPPPEHPNARLVTLDEHPEEEDSGSTPELVRSRSGSTPA